MFKHILVPLDGSRLAEAALPAASFLARTLHAGVTLLHVIERDAPPEIHGERHLTGEDEACAYLGEVARRAFPAGLAVEQHVHTTAITDVARSIVEHTGEHRADLIVMCTHGRGGLRSWLFGTIAQQVIALGEAPVLVVQPAPSGDPPDFTCKRLLVALDGDPEHEQGLPVAAGLAQACGADVHLIMVVHTPGTLTGVGAAAARLLPTTTSELLDLTERSGADYLRQHVAVLEASGLTVTTSVSRGDPTRVIIQTARREAADLIVLGTHGKTGMDAFWLGSVTPKIAYQAHLPLLLVRVRGTSSAD